jgi:hypothetical protein
MIRPHIVVQVRGGVSQRQRFARRATSDYRVSRIRRGRTRRRSRRPRSCSSLGRRWTACQWRALDRCSGCLRRSPLMNGACYGRSRSSWSWGHFWERRRGGLRIAQNNNRLGTMPPPPSSAKALNAILPLIAAGQAYEAHQKARTFASRYVKANQYDVAIDVLHQAAREMFKGGHLGSGTDLGVFMCDVYETKGETVDEESRSECEPIILITIKHSTLKTSTHNATYFTCWTRRTMEENPRR